jgi:hypothetical protein
MGRGNWTDATVRPAIVPAIGDAKLLDRAQRRDRLSVNFNEEPSPATQRLGQPRFSSEWPFTTKESSFAGAVAEACMLTLACLGADGAVID